MDQNSPLEMHDMQGLNVAGRFYGFPKWQKTAEQLSDLINTQIDIVNGCQSEAMPIRANNQRTQEDLNELHKYFEVLRGRPIKCGDSYKVTPEEVRIALERFNIFIHEYEYALATGNKEVSNFAMGDITFMGKRIRHLFDVEIFSILIIT